MLRFLQLNNLELAVNLAKRGNLPGAENLVKSLVFFVVVVFVIINFYYADFLAEF